MNRFLPYLLAILLLPIPSLAQENESLPVIEPANVGRLSLFVLAGQSNMSGRGEVPDEQPTLDGAYVFGNDYRWHPVREPVDRADDQVDVVSMDANAGYGPSSSFARTMLEHNPDMIIGLIPCAKGATIIEQWQRSVSDETLYGSCLKRIRAAEQMGRVEGVIFFQGESDAHRGDVYQGVRRHPDDWGHKFTTYVNDIRRDLDRPDLPIVFAQIGPHTSPERYVNWDVVRQQQASVDLPYVAMITTGDLSLRDRVHYDTPSYDVVGTRFAAAMDSLLQDGPRLWRIDLQGHRGARGLLPENSIPAFRKALDLRVNTLELDLGISKDSLVVVSHDPWFASAICSSPDGTPITRETQRDHILFHMPYSEIMRYDCGSRGHASFPEQVPMPVYKPLLDSVFVLAEQYTADHDLPPMLYNIEIKSREENYETLHPSPGAFAALVYEVVDRHGLIDRVTIQSFDPNALEATHAIDSSTILSLLVDNDLGFEENLARLTFTPDIYSPHHRLVDREMVESAHMKGMRVIPWTVNETEDMRRLVDLGVDGIITDYPDRGNEALGR